MLCRLVHHSKFGCQCLSWVIFGPCRREPPRANFGNTPKADDPGPETTHAPRRDDPRRSAGPHPDTQRRLHQMRPPQSLARQTLVRDIGIDGNIANWLSGLSAPRKKSASLSDRCDVRCPDLRLIERGHAG